MDVKEKRKLSSLVIYSVKSDLFKLKRMQSSKLAINVKAALHFSIEGHIGKRCLFLCKRAIALTVRHTWLSFAVY